MKHKGLNAFTSRSGNGVSIYARRSEPLMPPRKDSIKSFQESPISLSPREARKVANEFVAITRRNRVLPVRNARTLSVFAGVFLCEIPNTGPCCWVWRFLGRCRAKQSADLLL